MNKVGPTLEVLLHRLSEIPQDFLEEPMIAAKHGKVSVAALVFDLLRKYDENISIENVLLFEGIDLKSDRNRLSIAMILIWLLSDEWFLGEKLPQRDVLSVITRVMNELSAGVQAHRFVHDADRREELARVVLSELNYRPAGESVVQAKDRLAALSSTQRKRLIEESRAAEKRARLIREALVKKAAEESADKWTRE